MAKKNPSNEKELTSEQKLVNKISDFFTKNRLLLIIIAAVVVVGIVAAVVIVSSVNNAKKAAQEKVAALEDKYNITMAAVEQDWDALITELQPLVGGPNYPSVKAAYLLGLVYYEKGDYATARTTFMQAYNLNTKIYLAPASLVCAAACADAVDDSATALSLYNQVYSDYPDSGVAPRALFNAARIYLEQGNTQLAQASFAQVADYYPNSEYGKLAKNLANVL